MNDKMIGLKDLPVIRELVEETIAEIEDLRDAEVTIPVKTSELQNDSGFQTADEVMVAIAAAISETGHASFKKVDSIPSAAEAEDNVLYLVMNSDTNHYDIYAKVGTEVVLIDDTTVDLSDYATKAELSGKVDKVAGKGLSTNDYTTAEKTKLAGLTNYTHPSSHAASMITQDSTHRFVTDTEKAAWNNKKSVYSSLWEYNKTLSVASGKTTIYEGKGVGVTTLTFEDVSFGGAGTFLFRNATVNLSCPSYRQDSSASLVFENCDIHEISDDDIMAPIYRGTGDITLINSTLHISDITNPDGAPCYSGIRKAGRVTVIGGEIVLESGSTYVSGNDCNFIYECSEYEIIGAKMTCTGANRANLIYKGSGSISGGKISLANDKHSICHYTTDTDAHSTISGVTIDYYKTYLNFAVVTGCMFNHKAAGSSTANQIVMQCPTNMTGNHFIGSAAYIDGQSKKHIIDRNLSDNGITIGSAASGSVTTNNITY